MPGGNRYAGLGAGFLLSVGVIGGGIAGAVGYTNSKENALDRHMAGEFNRAGYKIENTELGWNNTNNKAENTYVVSRNDSLTKVVAGYKNLPGTTDHPQAQVISKTFVGMNTSMKI